MKKLNGFESYLVLEGLFQMRQLMVDDVKEIEMSGKNSIMTEGYINMVIDDTIAKIKALTIKQK